MNTLLMAAGWMLVIVVVGAILALRQMARVYPITEETYQKGSVWHWRIRGYQGDVLAESTHGYKHRHIARAAVRVVKVDGLEP